MKNVIVLAMALLLSASSFAQRKERGPARHDLQYFKSEINLTEEQEQQIKSINEEYKAKFEALRTSDAEREDKRDQMMALRKAQRAAISDVLTEEQKTQLTTLRREAMEERKDRRSESDRKAMREEMKSFRENTVMPVLQKQRAKLDDQISAEDKAAIEKLRQEFHTVGERMKQGPEKRGPHHFKGFTEEEKARRQQLKALVEKYEGAIDALLAEIEPQAKQWREKTKAIHEKYRPEIPEGKQERSRKRGAFKGKDTPGERAIRPAIRKGHFLMIDPQADQTSKLSTQPANELQTYPNPATGVNTLQYTIHQAGNIRIELRDRQG